MSTLVLPTILGVPTLIPSCWAWAILFVAGLSACYGIERQAYEQELFRQTLVKDVERALRSAKRDRDDVERALRSAKRNRDAERREVETERRKARADKSNLNDPLTNPEDASIRDLSKRYVQRLGIWKDRWERRIEIYNYLYKNRELVIEKAFEQVSLQMPEIELPGGDLDDAEKIAALLRVMDLHFDIALSMLLTGSLPEVHLLKKLRQSVEISLEILTLSIREMKNAATDLFRETDSIDAEDIHISFGLILDSLDMD